MDIKKNPFPKSAPKFVRMKLYKYHFTGSTNQIIPKNSVDWWSREFVSEYLPPLSLDREADIKQILDQMGIDTSPKNYNDNLLRKTLDYIRTKVLLIEPHILVWTVSISHSITHFLSLCICIGWIHFYGLNLFYGHTKNIYGNILI